jgi:hypothetical protein
MSLWDMPATCPEGHDDCSRVPSVIVAFSKDEYGDVTTAGRVDTSDYVTDGDCGNLWTREPVRGWDYTVDPDSGRIKVSDETTPPS